MNRFFMYVDPTEYEMTQEGLMKACLAEVIAEAKDTGDYPMYLSLIHISEPTRPY